MKTWVICDKNTYTKEERAKAILIDRVDPDAFVPVFVFDGKQYYRRVK